MRIVDRVAYLNHDIDDALRAGVLGADELPREPIAVLGRRRARSASTRSCTTSSSTPSAPATSSRASEAGAAMDALRAFMFERVYLGPAARREHAKIEGMLRALFDALRLGPRADSRRRRRGRRRRRPAGDRLLAGMTDRYCIRAFEALSVPEAFAL